MNAGDANVVTVMIAGQEYTLRSQASAEYTRQCAEYLDNVIREIRQVAGVILDTDRVAILAGLALADQLFQARSNADQAQSGTGDSLARLAAEIEHRMADSGLAATS